MLKNRALIFRGFAHLSLKFLNKSDEAAWAEKLRGGKSILVSVEEDVILQAQFGEVNRKRAAKPEPEED